jgi:hypothetical protein
LQLLTLQPIARTPKPPSDLLLAGLLAAVVLSVDASLDSRIFNFDGVACAIAVESNNIRHLAHGNHVLYGLLAWAFDGLWRLFGFHGRAILPLQVLNRLLHSACAAAMYFLLRRLRAGRTGAMLGAAALSISYSVWCYGLEPHTYLLGLLGLLAACCFLFASEPRPAAAGWCHALAVGGHATHVLFLPCAVYWLATRPVGSKKSLKQYLSAFAAGVAIVYLIGLAAVRPAGWAELARWLAGTAAIGPTRRFEWHGFLDPISWVVGFVGSAWAQGGPWSFFVRPGPVFLLHAAAMAAAVAVAASPFFVRRRIVTAMGLWLAAYFVFFSTWEPENMNYHLAELVPLWALVTLSLDGRADFGRLTLAVGVAALALNNWFNGIAPMLRPAANARLQEMAAVKAATPENAWVATGPDIGQVYVPYFAERKPLILADEARRPDAFELKEPVYVLPELLNDARWKSRLTGDFELEPVPTGSFTLYRLSKR